MTYQLKPLTPSGIPQAIEKAERYRLLNEPVQAESICRDILHTDPKNQRALIVLLLALTDQFQDGHPASDARFQELLAQLDGDYQKAYYEGIIFERRARAKIALDAPHAKFIAHELCMKAMALYEKAEGQRPSGNDDALLRWNACARMVNRHRLEPLDEDGDEPSLE